MGATRSRASRRGRRPRRPAEACANGHPPGNHPRRGQDPSLRTEPLTGAHANPRAGHARPLPCGGPGTGARVNPAGVSISPSVGRGASTPPRPPAAANNSPCLPPWGKVAPQGRMRGRLPLPPFPGQPEGGGVPDAPRNLAPTPREGLQPLPSPLGEGGPAGPDEGQAPAAAHSRANRRGRRPRRPAEACADVLSRVTTRGDSRCRQHPRRGQDPSLRTEPLTGACVNPRAGHARPLPGNNPTHLYTT